MLQRIYLLSILLLLAITDTIVVGLRTGAPADACRNITPQHNEHVSQTSPVPYTVDINSFNGFYIPEENYTSE